MGEFDPQKETYDIETEEAIDWGGEPDFDADIRTGVQREPQLPGRMELIRIARAEREIERLKGILGTITDAYRHQIEKHETTVAFHRAGLQALLEHGEKVSFPDLGSAYLTSVAARIDVVDKDQAEKVAEELGCVRYQPDMKQLKAKVLGMVEQTGEIPPGLVFVPPRRTVTVKRR